MSGLIGLVSNMAASKHISIKVIYHDGSYRYLSIPERATRLACLLLRGRDDIKDYKIITYGDLQ